MKWKLVGTRGNFPIELSPEEIDNLIKNPNDSFFEIQLTGYLYNEYGNVCGLQGRADAGKGYGFDNGWKEFALPAGETYTFEHEFTSVDGPSDWSDDSFTVTIQLVESE